MDAGIAIVIGAVLGTVGWFLGQRQNRNLSRLGHTIELLNSYRDDESHWDALSSVKSMIEAENLPKPDDANRAEDNATLRKLLVHYEYIASAILRGAIDERLVRDCDRSNIVLLYKNTENCVYNLTQIRKRDTIYENFQKLAKRWNGKPPGFFSRTIEVFLMRPL